MSTLSYAYAADRSPTGHPVAAHAMLLDGVWIWTMTHREVPAGTKLFAESNAAIREATFTWNFESRKPVGKRPVPAITV